MKITDVCIIIIITPSCFLAHCSLSCCAAGWFTDTSLSSGLHAGYPMSSYQSGCGGPGLQTWTTNTATSTGVYCKVNNGKYFSKFQSFEFSVIIQS